MAPTAMPSGAEVPNRWTPVQEGVGHPNMYQETRGGRYIDQMPFNLHHYAPPLCDMGDYSLRSFLPGQNVR